MPKGDPAGYLGGLSGKASSALSKRAKNLAAAEAAAMGDAPAQREETKDSKHGIVRRVNHVK